MRVYINMLLRQYVISYAINLMQLNTFWEANSCSTTQAIPRNVMETEGSMQCLHWPAIGSHSEPEESLHTYTPVSFL
jgi:hypothetical protein